MPDDKLLSTFVSDASVVVVQNGFGLLKRSVTAVHGGNNGPDPDPEPAHDTSTLSNAAGPGRKEDKGEIGCPQLRRVDTATKDAGITFKRKMSAPNNPHRPNYLLHAGAGAGTAAAITNGQPDQCDQQLSELIGHLQAERSYLLSSVQLPQQSAQEPCPELTSSCPCFCASSTSENLQDNCCSTSSIPWCCHFKSQLSSSAEAETISGGISQINYLLPGVLSDYCFAINGDDGDGSLTATTCEKEGNDPIFPALDQHHHHHHDHHPSPPVSCNTLALWMQNERFARVNRIKRIDLELSKLRQLQRMEQRHVSQQRVTQKSKATAMTPNMGSPVGLPTTSPLANGPSDSQDTLMMATPPDVVNSSTLKCPDAQNGMFLSMWSLFNADKHTITERLLTLCMSREQCLSLIQYGVIPYVIQLIHDQKCGVSQSPTEIRVRAGTILHHLVHSRPEDKRNRRDPKVLLLLEEIRAYSDSIIHPPHPSSSNHGLENEETTMTSPVPALRRLLDYSYAEETRSAICLLGGLPAVAELLQCNFNKYDNTNTCFHVAIRRYASLFLTNLTFGDGLNKALLCSSRTFLDVLVLLLASHNEEIRLLVAGLVRNLSWRADANSKLMLKNSQVVMAITREALQAKSELALKVTLAALWNLAAHCDENRVEICRYDGALAFIVEHLSYRSTSQSAQTVIVENSGAILRNVSSIIAVHPEFRQILRERNCLEVLVKHLRSSHLVWVSNACGILWNLSSRCVEDQERLWELGAVKLLEQLTHSKQETIAVGSRAALKNLLSARSAAATPKHSHMHSLSMPRKSSKGPSLVNEAQLRATMSDGHGHSSDSAENLFPQPPAHGREVGSSPLNNARGVKSDNSQKSWNSDRLRRGASESHASERHRAVQMLTEMSQLGDHSGSNHDNNTKLDKRSMPARNQASNPLSPPLSPQEGLDYVPSNSQRQQNFQFPQETSANLYNGMPPYVDLYEDAEDQSSYQHSQEPFPEEPIGTQHRYVPEAQRHFQAYTPADEDEEATDEVFDYSRKYNNQLESRHNRVFTNPQDDDTGFSSLDTYRQFCTEGSTTASVNDLRRLGEKKEELTVRVPSSLTKKIPSGVPKHVSSTAQATPMMFSRSSSTGTLSEAELGDDVMEKESVYSEFSRLGLSEAVSMTDIPASPSLMPTSPRNKRRILPAPPVQPVHLRKVAMGEQQLRSPVKILEERGAEETNWGGKALRLEAPMKIEPTLMESQGGAGMDATMEDSIREYKSEGLSGSTSLSSLAMSALTMPGQEQVSFTTLLSRLPLSSSKIPTSALTCAIINDDRHSPKAELPVLGNQSPQTLLPIPALAQTQSRPSLSFLKSPGPPRIPPRISSVQNSPSLLDNPLGMLPKSTSLNFASLGHGLNAAEVSVKAPMAADQDEKSSSTDALTRPVSTVSKQEASDLSFSSPPLLPKTHLHSDENAAMLEQLERLIQLQEEERDLPPNTIAPPPPLQQHPPSFSAPSPPTIPPPSQFLRPSITSTLDPPPPVFPQDVAKVPDSVDTSNLMTEMIYAFLPSKPTSHRNHHSKSNPSKKSAHRTSSKKTDLTVKNSAGKMQMLATFKGLTATETQSTENAHGHKVQGASREHLKLPLVKNVASARPKKVSKEKELMAESLLQNVQPPDAMDASVVIGADQIVAANSNRPERICKDAVPSPVPFVQKLTNGGIRLIDISPPEILNASVINKMDISTTVLPPNRTTTPIVSALLPNVVQGSSNTTQKGIMEASTFTPVLWDTDSDSDVSVEELKGRDSPDVFDTLSTLDLADCAVTSRFTSEGTSEDECQGNNMSAEQLKRPRIVKPVSAAPKLIPAQENIPRPIRGGNKSAKMPSAALSGLRPPSAGIRGVECETEAESVGTLFRPVEASVTPMRLSKQGTFTKDRPSQMVPVILPDSNVSKKTAARKRFASVTRGPRDSCSSLSSSDGQRGTATLAQPAPLRPGSSSSSRPHTAVPPRALPETDVIEPPKTAVPPSAPRKKAVSSKISFLWRNDKKEKPGQSWATPVEDENRESSLDSVPSLVKSPTLSEKCKTTRLGVALPSRLSSTLPKSVPQSAVVQPFNYSYKPPSQNQRPTTGQENGNKGLQMTANSSQAKGSLTVTSV